MQKSRMPKLDSLPPMARHTVYSALSLAALLLLCTLYVAIIGIQVDASALRGDVVRIFSTGLGREVELAGPIQLEISARPKLRAGGLHIANSGSFQQGEFASIGEVRLALDLWPLLLLRLQVEELTGSDVHIHLQRHADGSNNWDFASGQHPTKPSASTETADNPDLDHLLARLDIERVSLQDVEIEFMIAGRKSHFFNLHDLAAQFPVGAPLKVTLTGTVEKTLPYQLELTGGTLAALVNDERPWPFELGLRFMSSHLSVKGNMSSGNGKIDFALDSRNLIEFERLLQTKLPRVGAAQLTGSAKYSAGRIDIEQLHGSMGKTRLEGGLSLNYEGTRPLISGQLTLPVLDLRPFLSDRATEDDDQTKSLAEVYQEIARATFDLEELNSADADITLRITQWLNLPGAVQDAVLHVQLDHGRLKIPLQAKVAGVILSGQASANATHSPARFHLDLGTQNSSLGTLAEVLAGIKDLRGNLKRFSLLVDAKGNRGAELTNSMDIRLNIERGELSYGQQQRGRQVQFTLDKLSISLPSDKPLQGYAAGTLLGKTFHASLQGSTLSAMMQEANTPIDFDLYAADVQAHAHAKLRPPEESSGSEIALDLTAAHSSSVAGWFGLNPRADAAFMFKGMIRTSKRAWQLSDFSLRLGHSALTANVMHSMASGKPLLSMQLTSDLIDVDELKSLMPATPPKTPTRPPSSVLDIPILPAGVDLADADIVARIKHVATSSPFNVRDLSFDGHIRNGVMGASPFAANIADVGFTGDLSLDLHSAEPSAELWLAADSVNVGSIMHKLAFGNHVDANIDRMRMHLNLHSSQLGELLANSTAAISFEGGHITLRDANTSAKMRIVIDSGSLHAAAGDDIRLDLKGAVDQAPITIGIKTATAANLLDPAQPVPFTLTAATSGTDLRLDGTVTRPLSKSDAEFSLDMHGNRFDNLNALLHASMPPWGPWSASGKLRMSTSGYEIGGLMFRVGSSQLNGYGKLDTTQVPPRMDLAFTTPNIQLDDFRFGDWSPERKTDSKANTPRDKQRDHSVGANQGMEQLLSPAFLRRQNAYLTVRVNQVLSGKDTLGNGKFDARLEKGHLAIGPASVTTLGGSARMELDYEPNDNDVRMNFRADVKRFDYGILARRIDPKSDVRGSFSLDVSVNSQAPTLSEILRYGNGKIDFALWPESMKAGVLDMWAVNILVALLPTLDPANESRVNCSIGRFVLNNGKLTDQGIIIDTSRMRVSGKGVADFGTQTIHLRMQPEAKTPQFLSFAVPIKVDGTFNDFHVGVEATGAAKTLGQLATSVVWVPLQKIFGTEIPANGQDKCSNVAF